MRLLLSGVLLRYADYQKELEFPASSVRDSLERLTRKWPALRSIVFDGKGRLRGSHSLYLNGRSLGPDELDCAVGIDDVVEVATLIAGG